MTKKSVMKVVLVAFGIGGLVSPIAYHLVVPETFVDRPFSPIDLAKSSDVMLATLAAGIDPEGVFRKIVVDKEGHVVCAVGPQP
jgi:hypothetical protein